MTPDVGIQRGKQEYLDENEALRAGFFERGSAEKVEETKSPRVRKL
jgi:hypothetical protein